MGYLAEGQEGSGALEVVPAQLQLRHSVHCKPGMSMQRTPRISSSMLGKSGHLICIGPPPPHQQGHLCLTSMVARVDVQNRL